MKIILVVLILQTIFATSKKLAHQFKKYTSRVRHTKIDVHSSITQQTIDKQLELINSPLTNKHIHSKLKNTRFKTNPKDQDSSSPKVQNYNTNTNNDKQQQQSDSQPIPQDWVPAKYVDRISTYSKDILKGTQQQMEVGKPVYFMNNITFDDQPQVIESSSPLMTGVRVVQNQYPTQERRQLWDRWLDGQLYKDVGYNGKYLQEGMGDVITNRQVKVNVTNKKKYEKKDHVLSDTSNPLQRVYYTQKLQHVNELY